METAVQTAAAIGLAANYLFSIKSPMQLPLRQLAVLAESTIHWLRGQVYFVLPLKDRCLKV